MITALGVVRSLSQKMLTYFSKFRIHGGDSYLQRGALILRYHYFQRVALLSEWSSLSGVRGTKFVTPFWCSLLLEFYGIFQATGLK